MVGLEVRMMMRDGGGVVGKVELLIDERTLVVIESLSRLKI